MSKNLKPKMSQTYYLVVHDKNGTPCIVEAEWKNSRLDNYYRDTGRCYINKKDAEKDLKNLQTDDCVENLVRLFFSNGINWHNLSQPKYTLQINELNQLDYTTHEERNETACNVYTTRLTDWLKIVEQVGFTAIENWVRWKNHRRIAYQEYLKNKKES